MAAGFAAAVVRGRWLIVLAWIAAAWLATALLPNLQEAQSGALGDLVPADAEAIDAEVRSSELFGFPLLSRTVVVQRDAEGLEPTTLATVAGRAASVTRGDPPGLERIGGALPVANSTTALTFLLFPPEVGREDRVILAERYAQGAAGFVGITGAVPARGAQVEAIEDALPLVELGTVLLVGLVVGLHFRALVAPLAILLAVAISYLVSLRVVAAVGAEVGLSVPQEVEPVMVVLLFGIVTDYAVFLLSRFRRMLAEGTPAREAATATTAEMLGIIVTAGLTVAGAAASLGVAELGFFKAFGPGTAMAVVIGLLVAITFIPATLAIAGNALFWPSRPGRELRPDEAAEETPDERAGRPVRSRALRLASGHPALTAIGCTVVLLAAGSGVLRLEVGQTLIRGLPAGSEPREAYAAAATGFAAGLLSPTVVVVEGEGITRDRARLRRLQRRLVRLTGVIEVVGPRQQPAERDLGVVFSRTSNAVRYLVVFNADPLGAAAIARLRNLRAELPELMEAVGLGNARASIAGDTALAEETVTKAGSDLVRIAPAALLVVVLILAVFLRALVAPLYLVAASVLGLAASLGLAVYLFQDVLGHGELTFYVPFAAAVLLVALGSDYNVFLAGRIWQEARVRPLREAVAVAGARAATAITVAGVVLALSFALLALVPLRPFRELAFTMSAGLLLDAFLVRTLFVPALITLFGRS